LAIVYEFTAFAKENVVSAAPRRLHQNTFAFLSRLV
jgi:hypothetical protein